MNTIRDIMRELNEDFSNVDEINAKLEEYAKQTGTLPLKLVPGKNKITDEDKANQHPDLKDMTKVNGPALLNTGIGKPDKITIKDGKSLNGGVGDTKAFVIMGDVVYNFTQDYIVSVYSVGGKVVEEEKA